VCGQYLKYPLKGYHKPKRSLTLFMRFIIFIGINIIPFILIQVIKKNHF